MWEMLWIASLIAKKHSAVAVFYSSAVGVAFWLWLCIYYFYLAVGDI